MTVIAEPTQQTVPEPGVYHAVPFEVYAAWDALNNSGLSDFLVSPRHYYARRREDAETKFKALGTVCHAAIWERDRFREQYAIGPDVRLNTNDGRVAWELFAERNPGKYLVRGADGEVLLGVRASVWEHATARRLLSAPGPTELSVVWDDRETGVRCKARIDKLAESLSFVVDLKTTTDARPARFTRSVYDYGYYRQSAFNLHGLAAHGLAFDGFAIIAAETSNPYAVAVYELDQEATAIGWDELRPAIRRYAECRERDEWPAYDPEPVKIGLPDWFSKQQNTKGAL